MNERELKKYLLEAGASNDAVAKVDFAKIESIIDEASSIEDLCKTLKETYPDFDEAEFKKAIADYLKEEDAPQELSDDDLEAVAGGSVGSWLNENKAWLIPVVTTVAIVGIGVGVHKYRQYKQRNKDLLAEANRMFPGDYGEIKSVTTDSKGNITGYTRTGKLSDIEGKIETNDISFAI